MLGSIGQMSVIRPGNNTGPIILNLIQDRINTYPNQPAIGCILLGCDLAKTCFFYRAPIPPG